ncbi:MAG: SLAC1 anion channel family protein [Candidatus Aureabacteria bacterium]|nr:SLAC1 anion channel family protein [Candidatus Auribacterota bacterium]
MTKEISEDIRLKNFSISFFSITLGLIGYALVLQKAEHILKLFHCYAYVLYLTIAVFTIILTIYLIKVFNYPEELKKELEHPIKINFFPILAKIILIASIIYLNINMQISRVLWIIGTILQLSFSIIVLSIWLKNSKIEYHHMNPAWFIPIVGNVIVPIAGIKHGFVEISWFFFSIGLIMWLTLFVIVFNRLIFHDPIPEKLIPTFFILFAPPAIAFIAYVNLTGLIDPFSRILYYISLFLLIFIFAQVKMFSRIKFYLSWWAYSFPMSAITIATMLMYHKTGYVFFKILAFILLIILSLIISYLAYRTSKAIIYRELCVNEE